MVADRSLIAELKVEANRLRQSALRLAKLRTRVAADLAYKDAKDGVDFGPGSTGEAGSP